MKTTKSLPILAVSIVAWMAAGPTVKAADPPIYVIYQSGDTQTAPEPLQAEHSDAAQPMGDCSCQDDSACDNAYSNSCGDPQCNDCYGGARHPRLRSVVESLHNHGPATHQYRPNGLVAGVHAGMYGYQPSGHPLIDPWGRADYIAQQRAARQSWHAGYYHTEYCAPVALMVPPTARSQTRWGWGVAQSTMSPIYQQFERPYPGPAGSGMPGSGTGGGLLPTPRWPSHTDQFGVYYVRGPW